MEAEAEMPGPPLEVFPAAPAVNPNQQPPNAIGEALAGGVGGAAGGAPPADAVGPQLRTPQTPGPPLEVFPAAPAVNPNQQPPNAIGEVLAGGVGGAAGGPPPAEPVGAQLRTPRFMPHPTGRHAHAKNRVLNPNPVADDTLRRELIGLHQRFPTDRRRCGFTQGVLMLYYVEPTLFIVRSKPTLPINVVLSVSIS